MRKLTTLLAIGCSALAGCVGLIGGDDDAGKSGPVDPATQFRCDPDAAALTVSPIRRLARDYVDNALVELFSAVDAGARQQLRDAAATRIALIPADGSAFFAHNDTKISQDHVDAIFGVAVGLAAAIDADPGLTSALLAVCGDGLDDSALDDAGCLTSFVSHYGRKAYRRPLEQAEIDSYASFLDEARAEGISGTAALIGRMVGHPHFYYRFDAAGDEVGDQEGTVYRLTKWELLSKITFLFWSSPPSDALYDWVAQSDITEDGALRELIEQVLADPRAARGVRAFYQEWLQLDDTATPGSDGNIAAVDALLADAGISALPASHRQDMIDEVLDMTQHYTLDSESSLDALLTSPYSFARTPELAAIYGVAPWDGGQELVSLPAGERAGLITRAAFVATNGENTRPIIKGKRIRTQLLCTPTPPPPPDLEITPLVHSDDKTTRQATEEATASDTCMACHGQINPLGFASESYDPIGRWRTHEKRFADMSGEVSAELPVDTRATVAFSDGAVEVADAMELGQALADSQQVHACLVRNYFRFVAGREEDDQTDGCDLEGLRHRLTDDSLRSMLVEAAMQQSFRLRKVD